MKHTRSRYDDHIYSTLTATRLACKSSVQLISKWQHAASRPSAQLRYWQSLLCQCPARAGFTCWSVLADECRHGAAPVHCTANLCAAAPHKLAEMASSTAIAAIGKVVAPHFVVPSQFQKWATATFSISSSSCQSLSLPRKSMVAPHEQHSMRGLV